MDRSPDAALTARLSEALGTAIEAIEPVRGGANNRKYALRTPHGPLLLKAYFKDDRDRLGREYAALSYLGRTGVAEVPRPVLRLDDECCAVYSFEEGAIRPPHEWRPENAAGAARFLARLHGIDPRGDGVDFPLAVAASFSFGEMISLIRARLRDHLASPTRTVYPELVELAREIDVAAAIEGLIAAALRGLSSGEIEARLPPSAWRLTSADFGPHNILLRDDGSIRVLDWEYAGWDDPAKPLVEFGTHGASVGLPLAAVRAFEEAYAALVPLADADRSRIGRHRWLSMVNWAAIYLTGLTETKIESRRFAIAEFDLSSYLRGTIAQFHRQLAETRRALDEDPVRAAV